MNFKHIATGWSKSLGLIEVTDEERAESSRRMDICAGCIYAKESSFLMLVRGTASDMAAIYCGQCKCPVNEKTLVPEENCPEGFWTK